MTHPLWFRDVEIDGRPGCDCLIADGVVRRIGRPPSGSMAVEEIDGNGGAILPGLADHHLHLLAMAASAASAELTDADRLETVVSEAARRTGPARWARVVGYDDGSHGPLDRYRLDACAPNVPVRVQHRGGSLWVVNSRAIELIELDRSPHPGVERDAAGRPTGRLWRSDELLRSAADGAPPDLAPVGRRLAGYGITEVNDASPDDDGSAAVLLAEAVRTGALPQRVRVMGKSAGDGLGIGPRKVVISDHALPELEELVARVRAPHADLRPVALHCVTRMALLLALAALDEAGVLAGDRVEHCAVADIDTVRRMATMGLTVVTQPILVASRGDDYRRRCPATDIDDLWRYGSLLWAGIRTAPSSDAPYGDPDPWIGMRAAGRRRTRSGAVLGRRERVGARTVLAALLSPSDRPGGPPRRVVPGAKADLVLLDRPLAAALREPSSRHVRRTVIDGAVVHRKD